MQIRVSLFLTCFQGKAASCKLQYLTVDEGAILLPWQSNLPHVYTDVALAGRRRAIWVSYVSPNHVLAWSGLPIPKEEGWAGVLVALLGAVTDALHHCAQPPQYLPP